MLFLTFIFLTNEISNMVTKKKKKIFPPQRITLVKVRYFVCLYHLKPFKYIAKIKKKKKDGTYIAYFKINYKRTSLN